MRKDFFRSVPLATQMSGYRKRDLLGDLQAGLTVAVILVPQGMAYALLAGLSPIYGLYAGIVPAIVYGLFGSARQMSVGPVALLSLIILQGVGRLAEPGSESFLTLALATGLLAGAIQLLLGFLRLGFLINFLSHPVISGFTSAAAVLIISSQLGALSGLELPHAKYIWQDVAHFLERLPQLHWLPASISLGSLLLIFGLRRWNPRAPGALLAVVLGITATWAFGLGDRGLAVVGAVPSGLPGFRWPALQAGQYLDLFPLALTICLISFIETMAIARAMETKEGRTRVSPDQELLGLGLAKMGGALFQAFPTTGSFSRSFVNYEAGARSGLASIFSALLIVLILLFFTPIIQYLPKAVLGAIIVVSVIGLLDPGYARRLWRNDRWDFLSLVATFIATLLLGILNGVLFGAVLSLALIIYQNSRPNYAVLGRLPGSSVYRSVERFADAMEVEGVLIVRFDAHLFFGNASYFRSAIESLVAQRQPVRLFVLDASGIHDIDSTGVDALLEVIRLLRSRGIRFFVSGAIGPVRDVLYRNELMDEIGPTNQFLKIQDAIDFFRQEGGTIPSTEALQTNVLLKKDAEDEEGAGE